MVNSMNSKRGFTIIEIISVLVIITLIATMAIAGISGAKGRIDNKAYNSKIKLIEQAAAQYAKENSEKFKEEFGECTKTSGNCDCTGDECVYKFNTTVEELIELGYYDSELSKECLVENPKEKNDCFDKKPIEIIIDADNEGIETYFGEEFTPYDVLTPVNTMCELTIEGTEGTNGWYVGNNNKLVLTFKIDEENVARYGISRNIDKTYNNISEVPLSSTIGVTYYGYVKDIEGNEGSCILKNIKVDATNPTDPTMELDSSYNVVFSGSRDTYSERVKYSYNINGGSPIINPKYVVPSGTTNNIIAVHAFDYAGNISNTITKTLLIQDPTNETITQIRTYYCEEGYTCNTTPCKATSKCIKTEESITTEQLKYKCSLTGEIYNTLTEAKQNCMLHESGTVTTINGYFCNSGYTCSDEPCTQNSTCRKKIQESPTSTVKYKCDINGVIYNTLSEAKANCKMEESGTVTTTSYYTCPDGYTCSDNPCKSNSTCKKQVSVSRPTSDTYYICYIDGEYIGAYLNMSEATSNCKKAIPGVITTNTTYKCADGYKCSDGDYCNANSTCIKTVNPIVVNTSYKCYIDGTLVATYNTYAEASYYCEIERHGTVTPTDTYTCPNTYVCSDSPCKATSSCIKTESANLVTTTKYDCYIDGVLTGTYDDGASASSSCKKTVNHTVTPVTKYYCDSGYTCSNNCSSSSSTCTKTETASLNTTTKYTCSLHSDTLYNTISAATNACTDVQTSTKTYSYISHCSITDYTYSWGGYTVSDGEPSCSEQYMDYNCNSNRVGWHRIKCTQTNTKYFWKGYCIKNSVRQDITSELFETKQICLNNMNNYSCSTPGALFYHPDSCSSKNYYEKEAWICQKNSVKTYGPYYCNTSVNSSCQGSCPSGYTITTTRANCSNSSVQGLTCTSDKTCSSSTTTTCTKTGTVGTKDIYSCPSGYTCSDNCSSSSSTCTKVTSSQLRTQTKYRCSKDNKEYSTQNEANSACTEVTQGTITQRYIYSCPSGYTCSDNCSSSSSTCTKVNNIGAPNKITKYSCSVNNVLYSTQAEANEHCKDTEQGIIEEQNNYGCVNGYTCSSTPCTQNSKCSTTNKNKLYATNTYTCDLNNIIYSSESDANNDCVTVKTGNITTKKTYGCPSDYVCSDGDNCNANSTCYKYDIISSINTPNYYCSLTDNFYNSESEATQACHRTVSGNVTNQNVYTCRSGYTCSDNDCNSSSVCEKIDVQITQVDTKYYCSLTESFYNTQDKAMNACIRNTEGEILDHYVYKCNSPTTCSDEPCTLNSVCIKQIVENPVYDTVYYCSVNPEVVYTSRIKAELNCTNYCGSGKYNLSNKKCYILE